MDFTVFFDKQKEFSSKTFGKGERVGGIVRHIKKELVEIENDPNDLEERVDVILLALDGTWRQGYTAEFVWQAINDKLDKNINREWPDYSEYTQNDPIEHIK